MRFTQTREVDTILMFFLNVFYFSSSFIDVNENHQHQSIKICFLKWVCQQYKSTDLPQIAIYHSAYLQSIWNMCKANILVSSFCLLHWTVQCWKAVKITGWSDCSPSEVATIYVSLIPRRFPALLGPRLYALFTIYKPTNNWMVNILLSHSRGSLTP